MQLGLLDEPFSANDIEWRVQQAGIKNGNPWAMVLAYVTNRAIMKRLDDVCGKESWRNEFQPAPNGGVMCGISIKIGDEWVTKWDAAENTQVEAVKGGMSGAMKRAAVQWGIGRYLYSLDSTFANCSMQKTAGASSAKDKQSNQWFYWTPPQLPAWALPKPKMLNEDQFSALQNAITAKGYSVEQACGVFQVNSLAQITADQFNNIMGAVNSWQPAQQG